MMDNNYKHALVFILMTIIDEVVYIYIYMTTRSFKLKKIIQFLVVLSFSRSIKYLTLEDVYIS